MAANVLTSPECVTINMKTGRQHNKTAGTITLPNFLDKSKPCQVKGASACGTHQVDAYEKRGKLFTFDTAMSVAKTHADKGYNVTITNYEGEAPHEPKPAAEDSK